MPERGSRAVSLAALTVLEVAPAEAVRIARACGYSHVGLRPVPATPGEPHVPILSDAALRRELRTVMAGEGVAALDAEIVRLRPEMDWDEIERVLAFAQEFAIARLLVADNDHEPARSRASLARMAEIGAAHGVTPHLEFMPWTCAPNLAAARERIAGIANAALLIDAFHLARSGGVPTDVVPVAGAVGYLQLCDIAGPIPSLDEILREARSDRLFPGEGELDLAALLLALPGLPVSLEVPADRLRDAGWTARMRAQRAIAGLHAVLEAAGEAA